MLKFLNAANISNVQFTPSMCSRYSRSDDAKTSDRTRALERIKESFNFLPRIIGGINPIIPFATRYRAERTLFALTVSLHRALLNFQVERMIRRLSFVPCDQRSARCSTRTMIDDRARTLTKSRLSLSSRSYAMTRMSHWKIVAGWSL